MEKDESLSKEPLLKEPSKYAHFFKKDNGAILFHSLTMGMVRVHQSRLAELGSVGFPMKVDPNPLRQDLRKTLVDTGILVGQGDDDRLQVSLSNRSNEVGLKTLYVVPTFGCNLACRYCCFPEYNYPPGFLTAPQARKGVRSFLRMTEPEQKIHVVFFGGEPLLSPKTFIEIFEEVKKALGVRLGKCSIFTNATLVNRGIASLLAREKFDVIVSVDGPAHLHNQVRVFPDGSGSYDECYRGYQLLKEAGCRVSLAITVSKNNVENLTAHVFSLYEEWRPHDLGLSTSLHPMPSGKNPFQVDSDLLLPELITCLTRLRDQGIDVVEQLAKGLRYLVNQTPRLSYCSAGTSRMVLSPGGRIGPCEYLMAHGKFNHSFRKKLADSFEKQRWMDINYLMETGCDQCFALGICGGGCLYNIFISTGRLHGKDKEFCSQCRGLVYWAIEDIAKHAEKRKSLEEEGFIAVTSQDRRALMPALKNPAYDR